MSRKPTVLALLVLLHTAGGMAKHKSFPAGDSQELKLQSGSLGNENSRDVMPSGYECTGQGNNGLLCSFYHLVLWQEQFYYITSGDHEDISIPAVREGWHQEWHPYGNAMLPEHITVVNHTNLPWQADAPTEYVEQALIYNWLDTVHNLYHVMMENGNFIYATACRLLGACTHATSHYQILATGYFKDGEDTGRGGTQAILPAGYESLRCLSSKLPRWIGDSHWHNKVIVIGKSAVGVGGKACDREQAGLDCEWDPVHHMQNAYTSGHRKLMLDCLGVADDQSHPCQQSTQVTIVQRHYWAGRSLLDVAQLQTAVRDTGAQVQVVNMEGKTLKEQAEILARTHVYVLVHGAALALYMFLPKHAAIIEIQHFYKDSPVFPASVHAKIVTKYDMDYHHFALALSRAKDSVLQSLRVAEDPVYINNLTDQERLLLWEQGMCPTSHENLTNHCVKNWILYGSLVVDVNDFERTYHAAWLSLPKTSM